MPDSRRASVYPRNPSSPWMRRFGDRALDRHLPRPLGERLGRRAEPVEGVKVVPPRPLGEISPHSLAPISGEGSGMGVGFRYATLRSATQPAKQGGLSRALAPIETRRPYRLRILSLGEGLAVWAVPPRPLGEGLVVRAGFNGPRFSTSKSFWVKATTQPIGFLQSPSQFCERRVSLFANSAGRNACDSASHSFIRSSFVGRTPPTGTPALPKNRCGGQTPPFVYSFLIRWQNPAGGNTRHS